MNYEKMMRDHAHAEVTLFNAVTVLVQATKNALNDNQSTLNETTRWLLTDALQRVEKGME